MRLNRLELRHFISHESTDLAFNGARLATFVGANGSGKSALAIDALRYSLFDDARGRTDDLVQLGQTDMSVRAEITFAGAEYAITRGRSTKARGSSYLELAILSSVEAPLDPPVWIPLTGDTIKDTQAKIAELLRMDADTFDTAVLLGQGQANRFAEATAGDRKRILGTVLGLDLWERAEARAREEARDVEGSTAADRATIARLEAELAARPGIEEQRGDARRRDAELAVDEADDQKSRAVLQSRAVDVAAKAAAAEAAQREAQSAQAKLDEVAERYRRVSVRKAEATSRLSAAEAILATAPPTKPPSQVSDLEAAAAAQERAEAEDRELERAIVTNQAAVDQQRVAFERAVQDWDYGRRSAQSQVDQLTGQLATTPKVTCPKCAAMFIPSEIEVVLRTKLVAADRVLAEIGPEPQEPIHLAMEAAKVERLRANRRELAFDPIHITSTRLALRIALEAREAVAALEAQRQILETSRAAIVEAEAELLEIVTAGTSAREALTAAKERAAAGSGLASELAQVRSSIETVEGRLADVALARRNVAGELERAAGLLERLDRLAAEGDELAAGLADSDQRLGRLRRLVGAFGITGIPARIIESVLPELTASSNELLEQLRPGMTLDIRAQRAKKDGKGIVEALDLIVSDDVGERALGLYSGGERMSVSLALAVGLSRLVARRAGTAIRTLVIDEPDGLDADARRSFGQALRILAHQGELERVVLVSHHQDLADVGDSVYEVVKGRTGSKVTQIA
jgi:exonuclease SbcC